MEVVSNTFIVIALLLVLTLRIAYYFHWQPRMTFADISPRALSS